MGDKPRVPAIDGWFNEEPRLLGTRCDACGSYFFPKETRLCRNPACMSDALSEVPLSARGTVWSYTENCYAPPPPYIAPEPFAPFTIAAVELAEERMVVLGQLVAGASVRIGDEVELVIDDLYEDDDAVRTVFKWRPVR